MNKLLCIKVIWYQIGFQMQFWHTISNDVFPPSMLPSLQITRKISAFFSSLIFWNPCAFLHVWFYVCAKIKPKEFERERSEWRREERVRVGYIQVIFWLFFTLNKIDRPHRGWKGTWLNEKIPKWSYYNISHRINDVIPNVNKRTHVKQKYSKIIGLYAQPKSTN